MARGQTRPVGRLRKVGRDWVVMARKNGEAGARDNPLGRLWEAWRKRGDSPRLHALPPGIGSEALGLGQGKTRCFMRSFWLLLDIDFARLFPACLCFRAFARRQFALVLKGTGCARPTSTSAY